MNPSLGGTHLQKPLQIIHSLSSPHQHKKIVFVFSDGHIHDKDATLAAIRRNSDNVRLFTFGIRYLKILSNITAENYTQNTPQRVMSGSIFRPVENICNLL